MKLKADTKQLRSFGLLVGGIFALIGIWPFLFRSAAVRWWAVCLAGLLVVPGIFFPKVLSPLYRGWMALGHALGWFNTRVILGVFFFLIVTPSGIIRRFSGKCAILLDLDTDADTYRTEKSLRSPSHMARQF